MVETPYETEDVLQALLEDYPELLAGDERAEEPRRWLLIEREVSLASDEMAGGCWSWTTSSSIKPECQRSSR